jgi:hypothetical protein
VPERERIGKKRGRGEETRVCIPTPPPEPSPLPNRGEETTIDCSPRLVYFLVISNIIDY